MSKTIEIDCPKCGEWLGTFDAGTDVAQVTDEHQDFDCNPRECLGCGDVLGNSEYAEQTDSPYCCADCAPFPR